jgi:predicted DNA-binding transcriptional regulator AlpA
MPYDQNELDLRSSKEVARVLGVTVDCLINWRRTGAGPVFITIGSRKVAYDMKDVAAWLEAKKSNGSVQSLETAGEP